MFICPKDCSQTQLTDTKRFVRKTSQVTKKNSCQGRQDATLRSTPYQPQKLTFETPEVNFLL
ncbi:hypothetical protein BT69DRAFT_1278752, partial [Atractiella rhizophila]